ncbi:MAG: hypothetical protein EAX96_08770 [Candidatus Lokiarchaeota archaeon]|nr:hypothetical protein [Candidatus Lokiarchaeota archaeon]
MEIHDVFILRNGVPIYHKRQDEKTKEVDETLLMGFLSAITGFGEEIGLGKAFEYVTNEIKFSFYENSGLVYIICCDLQVQNEFLHYLSSNIANKYIERMPEIPSSKNMQDFDRLVSAVIKECINAYIKPEQEKEEEIIEMCNDDRYATLVPKCHFNGDTFKFSGIRRELFKLINGKNSIQDISNNLTENPNKILNILRSYQKEGFISF